MQYSVPQFIEVEDQILPHLTIKQFLMLIFGGLLGLVYWVIFDIGVIFFILLVLTFMLIVPVTFFKFNGRSLLANFPNLMHYARSPRYRVFMRMGSGTTVHKQEQAPEQTAMPAEPQITSRLKKLAYLLDEKTAEEERLLRTRTN